MVNTLFKKYVLLSVYDKTGIADFAKQLNKLGYKIISTGGTAKALQENGVEIIPIQEITGSPESFNGRVKTISFQIASGILFDRSNPEHNKQASAMQIPQIDIVVCNLYPFEQTVQKLDVTQEEAIENIDVGGPTMLRAAAKNFKHVIVVVDPNDYEKISEYIHSCHPELVSGSQDEGMPKQVRHNNDKDFRQSLAAKAFAHLSFYDSQIARFFNEELFPNELTLPGRKKKELRYGENPHQKAALYMFPNNNSPLNSLERKWGRELSHVNVADIYAGLESVRLFNQPCATIIKHNCPCGIGLGETIEQALSRAIKADPESAFGGIVVLNKPMDLKTANVIGEFKDERKSNMDIIAAPFIEPDALEYLKTVRKSMGIYTFGSIPVKRSHFEHIRFVDGGFLYQTGDNDIEAGFADWEVVTKKKPSAEQTTQMRTAWKFISRIKSNAVIVVDKEIPMTRGIGTGQTSRVRSVKIALEQAGKFAKDAILASDGFFPFADSVELAVKAGIAAVVQPGGSVNDKSSIEAADQAGIAMIFTHRRAFWH